MIEGVTGKWRLGLIWRFVAAVVLGVVSPLVHGDALVVTKAASSSTIAEIFVDREGVRVELEVGLRDLPGFQGILPEAMREELLRRGLAKEGDELRSPFLFRPEGGDVLVGETVDMGFRPRLRRDAISGEPLSDEDEEVEKVLFAELSYPFAGDVPKWLTVETTAAPERSSVGFMAYHSGLPVNDFRYLSGTLTLDLNWEDEWYSAFRHSNLRRQNFAPLSAYLYVEPYEVRKEILIRPRDVQRYVDLGLEGKDAIPVEDQEELKAKVVDFLRDKGKVTIDGEEAVGELDRIHFVRRSLRMTGIVDPPEELSAGAALLGVIYSYPVDGFPQEVELRWDFFDELIEKIPAASTDEAGPLPMTLTPEYPVLEWKNYLKNPVGSKFRDLSIPKMEKLSVPVVTVGCLALGLILLVVMKKRGRLASLGVILVGLIAYPIARVEINNPFGGTAPVAESKESVLIEDLLFNVYRAFDRRDQEVVFDRLSRSIAGDLLEEVYLDTRRSIEVENQGGLQVKIDEVKVLELERLEGDSPSYRCRWLARGSVAHWGHVHRRENERTAEMTLSAVDGAWKIVGINLLDES